MNKLNVSQIIALIFILGGIILAQLETFGVNTATIGIISSVLGTLKMLWDSYRAFTAQDVADFANAKDGSGILAKSGSSTEATKSDVKSWAKNR